MMNQSQDKSLQLLPLLKYWVPLVTIVTVILNTSILLFFVDLVMITATSIGISTPPPVLVAETVRSYGNVILVASVLISVLKRIREKKNV